MHEATTIMGPWRECFVLEMVMAPALTHSVIFSLGLIRRGVLFDFRPLPYCYIC